MFQCSHLKENIGINVSLDGHLLGIELPQLGMVDVLESQGVEVVLYAVRVPEEMYKCI